MGRPYTGADYTSSALKININQLIRWGLIAKGRTAQTTLTYNNHEAEVKLEAMYTDRVQKLFIEFRLREANGTVETWSQSVDLEAVPSNLGKGEVLYFICPRTRKRCRVLYRAYHSKGFYSRQGFSYRLYYPQQASSHYKKVDRQFWRAEAQLEELLAKRRTSTYMGKPTRRSVRTAQLEEKVERLEDLRWSPQYMPKSLRGVVFDEL